MISITLPAITMWDELNECFINFDEVVLELEHSLVSITKWESKWLKAFISDKEKTDEETIEYIRCMILNEDVDEYIINRFTVNDMEKIKNYIDEPMTAIKFRETFGNKKKGRNETITNEVVYYWMAQLQIPFECENWHFSRLINLIRVFDIKNTPAKKLNAREQMSRYSQINAQNRARFNSKG